MQKKKRKGYLDTGDMLFIVALAIICLVVLALRDADTLGITDLKSNYTETKPTKEIEISQAYQKTLYRNKPVPVKEDLTLTYTGQTEEGMILLRDSKGHYLYFRKDHRTAFKNVRMEFPQIAEDEVVIKVLPKIKTDKPLAAPKQ